MREIPIYSHSRIMTVHLDVTRFGEDVIIGSTALQDSFIKSNQAGLEAIEFLNQGHSLRETQEILSTKYQQNISITELVTALSEANLIFSIDEQHLQIGSTTKRSHGSRWKKIASAAFSPPWYLMYGLLFVITVLTNLHRSTNIALSISSASLYSLQHPIVAILIAWILVLKHEWFHYLAALSLGIPAQIKIGSRFIFIVLETQADAIYLITKGRRYRFYFAGMVGDLLIVVILFHLRNLLAFMDIKINPQLIDLCVMQTIVGIIFQFDIFFKTDLYFAFAEFLGKDNLYTNSGFLLKHWWLGTTSSLAGIEDDVTTVIFTLGRLLNYVFISLIFISGVFLLVTNRQELGSVGIGMNGVADYINGSVYMILFLFINIITRKNKHAYKLLFHT